MNGYTVRFSWNRLATSASLKLRGPSQALRNSAGKYFLSRRRDLGPGAYLFVVFGTSTCLQAGKPKCALFSLPVSPSFFQQRVFISVLWLREVLSEAGTRVYVFNCCKYAATPLHHVARY